MSHPTISFSDSEMGLFSPTEIQELIRIEFDRATRYRYPLALMLVEVDRLEYLHHLYGLQSKEEVMQTVLALLRSITRASDFLGCMLDERIMAAFPHTPESSATMLAGRLLQGVRQLEFQSDGRALRSSLSIGVATLDPGEDMDFDTWVESAEGALRFALESGGDRYVQRKAAHQVFEELRQDLNREAEELAAPRPSLVVPGAIPGAPSDAFVADQLRSLFDQHGDDSEGFRQLREDVLGVVNAGIQALSDGSLAGGTSKEHERKMKQLEARVDKLRGILETTESELARVARSKGIDPGLASIYRTVQGLAADDRDSEAKRGMLSLIFEANKKLRSDLERDS